MKEEDVQSMITEVEILQSLNHPNVVQMKKMYEDKSHYCIVMELMEGGCVSYEFRLQSLLN